MTFRIWIPAVVYPCEGGDRKRVYRRENGSRNKIYFGKVWFQAYFRKRLKI